MILKHIGLDVYSVNHHNCLNKKLRMMIKYFLNSPKQLHMQFKFTFQQSSESNHPLQ